MKLIKNIILTQMHMAEKLYGIEPFFNKETEEICLIEIKEDGKFKYYPLLSEEEPYPITEIPLTAYSISGLSSEKISIVTESFRSFIGKIAGLQQPANSNLTGNRQKFVGTPTGNKQTVDSYFSEPAQDADSYKLDKRGNVVGTKANSERFFFGTVTEKQSHMFSPETEKILKLMETNIDLMLSKTDKKKTIQGLLQDYNTGIKYANKNELQKLVELNKLILRKKEQQQQIIVQQRQWKADAERRRKRRIIIFSILSIVAFLSLLYFAIWIGVKATDSPVQDNVEQQTEQTSYNAQQIKELITLYCEKQDTTLSDWRIQFITDELALHPLTEDQLITKLDSLAKN